MDKYKNVIDLVRREDVTLFVGSGCSLRSGAPSGHDLAKQLWNELTLEYREGINENSLQDVSEALVIQDGNRERLNKILTDTFSNLQPSSFHKNLLKIPHIHTFITTNYDSLIESAYTLDYFQTMANDKELAAADPRKVQLLKIHGDLKHLDNIIITKSDYRRFHEDKLVWSRITAEFTSKNIVFVGYSVEDDNILNLIDKIIDNQLVCVNQMYIIAPNLNAVQNKRLKDLGLKYIKGTGEDFLEHLIAGLKESFGEDKYNNICSLDTLNRFGLLNNVLLSFENDGRHTSITKWKGLNNSDCHLRMHFSTKSFDIIEDRTPVTVNDIVKGFSVPMYALNDEELATFRMELNGLRINGFNEMKQVMIGPAVSDIDIIFRSHDSRINCRCKAKRYVTKGTCHILIPTPLFNIEFKVNLSDIDGNRFYGNLTATLNEGTFEDLEKAKKWVQLMVAIQDGTNLKIQLGKIPFEGLNFSNENGDVPLYSDWLAYCNNLSEIERVGNLSFPQYECFTQDSFLVSKIVHSYITKTAYNDKCRKNYKSFNVNVTKGNYKENSDIVARVVTPINGPVSFCGIDFEIGEERVFLGHCRIESILQSEQNKMTLHVRNLNDQVQYEYCDSNAPNRFSVQRR